jgi:membrane protease YdiL (CAAX protease family)
MEAPPVFVATENLRNARSHRPAFLWLGFLVGYATLFVVGGEARRFAWAGLNVVPFVVLVKLSNAAENKPRLRFVTVAYWLILATLGLLEIAGIAMIEFLGRPPLPEDLLEPGVTKWFGLVFITLVVAVASGLACFLPAVRSRFAKIVNIDEKSFVHAAALATVVSVIFLCFSLLVVTKEPPLLLPRYTSAGLNGNVVLRSLSHLYSLVWSIPGCMVLVGYPKKRNLRDAFRRLAVELPTRRQIVTVLLVAALLVPVMREISVAISWVWRIMHWGTTNQGAVRLLFSYARNPVGALVASITAGFGEELIFRGVLQPRFGILITSILFALVHAFQYRPDVLVQVFLLGLIQGYIRNVTNTPTAAIVHSAYDFVLFLSN